MHGKGVPKVWQKKKQQKQTGNQNHQKVQKGEQNYAVKPTIFIMCLILCRRGVLGVSFARFGQLLPPSWSLWKQVWPYWPAFNSILVDLDNMLAPYYFISAP